MTTHQTDHLIPISDLLERRGKESERPSTRGGTRSAPPVPNRLDFLYENAAVGLLSGYVVGQHDLIENWVRNASLAVDIVDALDPPAGPDGEQQTRSTVDPDTPAEPKQNIEVGLEPPEGLAAGTRLRFELRGTVDGPPSAVDEPSAAPTRGRLQQGSRLSQRLTRGSVGISLGSGTNLVSWLTVTGGGASGGLSRVRSTPSPRGLALDHLRGTTDLRPGHPRLRGQLSEPRQMRFHYTVNKSARVGAANFGLVWNLTT